MDIKVTVDADSVVKLTAEVLRQLPYALNNALSRTAKEAAQAAQHEASEHLQIRKNFILKRIRVLTYSRVGNLTAVIGVDPLVQGSPLLLGFLEEGQSGEKTGTTGQGVAIPLTGEAARPAFADSVVPKLLYKRLQMEKHVTARGAVQWKGKQRTFVIPGVGIFQRIASQKSGSDQSSTALIYAFKPSARLGPHVRLREAMLKVIGERFAPIFREEFIKELSARAAHLMANK